ncbi:hypothetical protein PFLG_01292 [Plasmodium falciparum RAJ116]|uniref:Merozoite surface protein C-terminal domain-containing protein n=2 Tax=Plasmodium falciparum TaxID=5833 RepID=A0A0L0CWB4_PLAFA|nr:hypothetical protein PFLG_01292 [Plasmodium falciparum RAJ116]
MYEENTFSPSTAFLNDNNINIEIEYSNNNKARKRKIMNYNVEEKKYKIVDVDYDEYNNKEYESQDLHKNPKSKYDNLNKKMDNFTMNENEYEIVKKLVNMNEINDMFKKILSDDQYMNDFKIFFILYLYSYAKKYSYLKDAENSRELYKNVYKNTIGWLHIM